MMNLQKNLPLNEALAAYEGWKAKGLKLNMARGKPSPRQLELSDAFFTAVDAGNFRSRDGVDCRNYGELYGIKEARALMASMMGLDEESVYIAGCSSLSVMYDVTVRLLITAAPGAVKPWFEIPKRKVLCPSPGYDRHFHMSAGLGFELIPVAMDEEGPDVEQIRELLAADPDIKAIWCVPYYSNPSGICYSERVCRELAAMAAAPDFRIFWDMAYCVHHLYPEDKAVVPNMLELCRQAGHPDRVLAFASTSKISFAGGGIAAFAASEANRKWFTAQQKLQMICTDKVNQLRHAHFFAAPDAVDKHMRREADILRPKFEAFHEILSAKLADLDSVSFSKPRGGYFIALNLPRGTAKRVVQLADEAGLILTPAGCTHPYDHDPDDAFLRIAPSFPELEEIKEAAELLCCCIRLAVAEKN